MPVSFTSSPSLLRIVQSSLPVRVNDYLSRRNVLLLLYLNGRSCDDATKSGSRKDHKEAENKMWKTCEPEHIIHRFVVVDNGNGTSDDDANFILSKSLVCPLLYPHLIFRIFLFLSLHSIARSAAPHLRALRSGGGAAFRSNHIRP